MDDSSATNDLDAMRGTSFPDAKIWTRSGSGPNIVVLTDKTIFIGLLPRKGRKAAGDRIVAGEMIESVLGEHYSAIPLASVERVRAESGSEELNVEYRRGPSQIDGCRITFADPGVRQEAMREVQNRLPWTVERNEEVSSRLLHIIKPLNYIVVLTLLAFGAHAYFNSRFSKIPQQVVNRTNHSAPKIAPRTGPRLSFEERVRRNELQNIRVEQPQNSGRPETTQDVVARQMARNKRASGIIVLLIAIVGTIGFVLGLIGYKIIMTSLIGCGGLCVAWMVYRILDPPRTVTLVRVE